MKTIIALMVLFFVAMADPYERAINFVLAHEGGYCHDRGWESNFGICSKWYPKEDIKNMTVERAKEIYRRDYWERMNCHVMADTMMALLLFDCAVLFGQPTAKLMARNCYSAACLMERRISATCQIIQKNKNDHIYLKSWISRIADLSAAITTNNQ